MRSERQEIISACQRVADKLLVREKKTADHFESIALIAASLALNELAKELKK